MGEPQTRGTGRTPAGAGPVKRAAPGQVWRGQETRRLIRLVERVNDGWACDVEDSQWPEGGIWRGGEWVSDWQLSWCEPVGASGEGGTGG